MNAESRRDCPFCAEQVPATARVCPRCRQWLTWKSLRHPVVSVFAFGLPTLAFFAILSLDFASRVNQIFNPRPFYSEVVPALTVVESRLNWVALTNGPVLYVTGMLTNESDVAWNDLEFECRFYDAAGNMVDAAHAVSRMTVDAHDNSAFRANVRPGRPQTNYATHRVTVSNARNARSRF